MDMKLDAILAAYRGGLNADILQAKTDGKWGPLWTIPPCSPRGMEQMGQQFRRCRAEAVRHYRRARLRRPSATETVDVMVVTELPEQKQHIASFDGAMLQVNLYLEDAALVTLAVSFLPPRP